MSDSLKASKEALLAQASAEEAEKAPLLQYKAPEPVKKAAAPPPPSAFEDAGQQYATHAGFSSDLCDCCIGPQACQICCLSWFLPCFAHGLIANDASDGASSAKLPCALYTFAWSGAAWLLKTPAVATVALGTLTRSKLRMKYGMPTDGCADCCTHFWCHPCAMAQEIRHIRDQRIAMASALGPGGVQATPPEQASMKLISWEPVRAKDEVASLTSAYL